MCCLKHVYCVFQNSCARRFLLLQATSQAVVVSPLLVMSGLQKDCALESLKRTWLLLHACRLPQAEVIPGLNRAMVTRADGSMLNTCSSDVLVEVLRFLKRAYWPFPWQSTPDNATGGFTSAATVPCSHPPLK